MLGGSECCQQPLTPAARPTCGLSLSLQRPVSQSEINLLSPRPSAQEGEGQTRPTCREPGTSHVPCG